MYIFPLFYPVGGGGKISDKDYFVMKIILTILLFTLGYIFVYMFVDTMKYSSLSIIFIPLILVLALSLWFLWSEEK